jgi:hypothetical protein
VPVGLSITEVALIVLTIRENLPAVAMGHVRLEVPLKLCSVRPNHNTHSVFDGGLVSQPVEIMRERLTIHLCRTFHLKSPQSN